MAFGRPKRHAGDTTVTTTTTTVEHPAEGRRSGRNHVAKPSLKQRLFGTKTRAPRTTTATPVRTKRGVGKRHTPRTTAATTTPRRKTSVGDKVSGAMLKLKGSLTHRPGEKAAGTRRMRGTDGKGSRRAYY